MGIEIGLSDIRELLSTLGITLTDKQFAIAMLGLLVLSFGIVSNLLRIIWSITKYIWNIFALTKERFTYDDATKRFIKVRNRFAEHLISEVKELNRKSDWNDFYYTRLEAEVEVDPFIEFELQQSKLTYILQIIPTIFKSVLSIAGASKSKRNLVEAILDSKARSFLVIGDPGSGKTVSLRHLFLRLAEKCEKSNAKSVIVPIYLNLKFLNIPPQKISADKIREWILDELSQGQDRLIYQFLNSHFEEMLDRGDFFFLFDSFDEIPAVMDAHEDAEIVHQYATSLSRFIHSPHGCRGLVTSRPFRAPKSFNGQRITIRPLSHKRIKSAVEKYLVNDASLSKILCHELFTAREDLLHISSNPFYLGLLVRFIDTNSELPNRQYDLFEHFINTRVNNDQARLKAFDMTPNQTLYSASVLAFAMSNSPSIGLEVRQKDASLIMNTVSNETTWNESRIDQLFQALTFSKIGRIKSNGSESLITFGFVHRRFHEYLCARFLRTNILLIPIENLVSDNRWREILVLLCEVLELDQMSDLLKVAESSLNQGLFSKSNTLDHSQAIETLRFLRDGFRSRLEDLPISIQQLSTDLIIKQLNEGDLLDKKRAVENIALARVVQAPDILVEALASNSQWLRETCIKACRDLKESTPLLSQELRFYFFEKYSNLTLYREYNSLNNILLSSTTFHSTYNYLRLLWLLTILQAFILIPILIIGSVFTSVFALLIIFSWNYFSKSFIFPETANTNKSSRAQEKQNGLEHFFDNVANKFASLIRKITFDNPKLSFKKKEKGKKDYERLALKVFRLTIANSWLFMWLWTLFMLSEGSLQIQSTNLPLVTSMFFMINILAIGLSYYFPASLSEWLNLPVILLSKIKEFISLDTLRTLFTSILPLVLAVILATVFGLFGGIALLVSSPYWLFRGFLLIVKFFREQMKFFYLSLNASARPNSVDEALIILQEFSTDIVKVQFVRALFKWIPVSREYNQLIRAAYLEQGMVRDLLCQLAEIWDESFKRDFSV